MLLAAGMVLQQCRLQLVKLRRPFGLSLLRLFESFNIIVYFFCLLSFIGIFACSVFCRSLFCILYFICILLLLLPTWRIKLDNGSIEGRVLNVIVLVKVNRTILEDGQRNRQTLTLTFDFLILKRSKG